ncbi:hypothetical protein Mgra_00000630 [Meloidogyne graminicola]|uniref:RRM domain-containing protein n=1 Tax=Meloidogyne graminicola TaxID=189291 RepID=A0A8T0A320_9BILA|nr:hypothetical protein Mgra_00000630 [Meloidogyne graminicola]
MDLQMDKEGKTKGMAVCEYSHPIEAVQAVSMLNGQRLFDRTLAVRMDRYPKDIERRDPGGLPFGLRGVGMGLGANGAPLTDVASVISNINSSSVSTPLNGTVAPVPTPLLATTIAPVSLSWGGINTQVPLQAALQQVLPQQEQHGGHFQSSNQPTTFQSTYFGGQPSGQSSRLTPGIPQFGGSGGGSQYSTKTSPNFSSQTVATQQASVGMKYEYNNSSGFGSIGGSSMSGSIGGSYEVSRIILIKNLPVDYTWQIVSDRVQQFGDLESVEMITPGVAKVRFVQLKDAERTKAALQGTTVEGRMINIEYL